MSQVTKVPQITCTKDIEDLCKLEKKSKKQLKEKYQDVLDEHSLMMLSNKPVRSWSGVLVLTVVMRPDKFSCPHNCHYCPNEPGQPRSYLSSEPAVARANENDFDAVKQIKSRLDMLKKNGHNKIDKIEIIVLGGTFSAYPRDYQYEFVSDLYYGVNIYNGEIRAKKSLENEQKINETALYKIIGLSLETRPDHINFGEIKRLRDYGCTRVQLGIQHTDDTVLKIVNRGHDNKCSKKAIKMLKNNGFKVDMHIMPDLPGSNPIMDKIMMETILNDQNYKPDYLKIYPCLDVDFTEIKQWKIDGRWKPYSEENIQDLIDVVLHAKVHSKYYTRFNRIQRDFPEAKNDIVGFSSNNIKTNFRQLVQNQAKDQGIKCKCIRCCEIKSKVIQKTSNTKLYIEHYASSGSNEKYISFYSDSMNILHGFIRLRLSTNSKSDTRFKVLENCALIRELHVYGFIQKTSHKSTITGTQHKGFGKALLAIAECYAIINGYSRIAIISGVGVRKYYEKMGYMLSNNENGQYMIKEFSMIYILYYIFRAFYYYMLLLIKLQFY